MPDENIIKFEHMKRYFFDQETTKKFLQYLTNKSTVIAPHRKGENSYSFEQVTDVDQVLLDYTRTIQPLKKYFLPPTETLLYFNLEDNTYNEQAIEDNDIVFFAIHAYDMQGVLRLDYSFRKGNPELNYFKRRERCKFIGISYQPDEWHFSKSVGIEIEKLDGFCLFFEPVENGYLVFEIDEDGRRLLNGFNAGVLVDTPLDFEIRQKNFSSKIKYHAPMGSIYRSRY